MQKINIVSLPAPVIDKIINGTLNTNKDVTLSVTVDNNLGYKPGDTINVIWGGNVFDSRVVSENDISLKKMVFPVPEKLITNGNNVKAAYIRTDENLQVTNSEALFFTVNLGGSGSATPDNVQLTIAKDNAAADGQDTNMAAIVVSSANTGIDGISVDLTVSGNALFVNGRNQATVKTKNSGIASLGLTDASAEKVQVFASVADDASLYDKKTATFISPTTAPDTLKLETFIDHSDADGKSPNAAVATVTANGSPVSETPLNFIIRGTQTAFFDLNGRQEVNVKTDSSGTFKVNIVDTVAETITLYCSSLNNSGLSQHTALTFEKISSGTHRLMLDVMVDNSISGSGKANTVMATVTNDGTGVAERDIPLSFDVTQHAWFQDSKTSATTAKTDQQGKAIVSILDDTAEHVIVSAHLEDNTSASQIVTFKENFDKVVITDAYNMNKKFAAGQPSTAWEGATFILKTAGGSQNFAWEVISGANSVSVSSLPDGQASVTVTSPLHSTPCIIRVTDKETGEIATFQFSIEKFYKDFKYKVGWAELIYDEIIQKNLLSIPDLLSVYNEWGDMSKYGSPWNSSNGETTYWSSQVILYGSCEATVIDLSDGSSHYHLFPELLLQSNKIVTLA
ncbi:hypothetical protein ABW09_17090 [Pluralibacter gergoviae]|uniref:Ig-like domain-containing protein n=1 Tax=Pluralibacter gergoviae TaxID=61647 RepID=UPI0006513F98|nr:Ig-like domain-containing protein [Pluralibacter gergoviae]KMK16948.1 hypothetical protein ABW09_17090 [Pluralibacter gergoviae]